MLSALKRLDWILVGAAVLLTGFGLFSVYSSSADGEITNFYKQIAFLAIGLLAMVFLSFIDWRVFRENSYLILFLYLACLLLLLGLFFWAPEIRGVKSWYRFGLFSVDPIEFTKIILIIILAKYFSKRHVEIFQIRHIVLSGFYVFLPVFLTFFQPNMGSVIILVALWIGVLIVSGIKIPHFLALLLTGILVLAFSWSFLLKDYQKNRIISFVEPSDPLGLSWSQNQAKIAVGSGGLLGKGFGSGSQTQYGFLPESQNDFIFAAIAEETGLAGCFLLFSLFALLFWRIFKILLSCQNNFSRLFATGFAIILIVQIFINIGMNLGLMPIIGISLPFVSYGGSGLIAVFCALGILQSIKMSGANSSNSA
ncbi:MAG: FtsW/RodA/SpoVE family cell cycle protein [Candidatus Pacebacteria bacterium]|nr:FtsW/RodA/SpoVE family cell cycle protein [Candidatus Paceibacterota bacterium]